ncbi:unnamed protein product [Arctia plantaginis]|uniref:Major facilitator superfamily (MFS) profile domain-containing protein n=1 Tax=Arctia plantaginis TaxID=874455 RepID=A0A8S1ACC8_ARCPL|nr:unnamed protein product [Arctia plantaginis]
MGVLFQILATVLLCFSCMNMGLIYTWPSSTILLFKSENTTLHRPMEGVETALFGSLPAIGSLIIHPVAGIALDKFGRKRTALLTSLVFVMSWSIIAVSNKVEAILVAAFLSGFGYAIFMEVTIYISEIAQDSIRGVLTSCPNQFSGFGILISYFLGGSLGYYAMVYTCLSLTVIGVLMIAVLKESPITLLGEGRDEEAANSLAFYRSSNRTSKEIVTELNNIRRTLKSNSEEAYSLTQGGVDEGGPELEPSKISCWQHFKTTPSTRRQFSLVMVLHTVFVCQGFPIVQVYAEPMFTEAVGDTLSPNLCSIILGLVVLLAGMISAYLTDVVGRRPLELSSSIVTGICCLVLGTQIVTECLPKWTVPLLIYVFATSHTLGTGTVPFVVSAEVFLPEVKSILMMIATEWSWICNFCFLFLFDILVQSAGLAPMFYFFSFVCFVSSVYFFYFLPETKGLPVYAIQALFMKEEELKMKH